MKPKHSTLRSQAGQAESESSMEESPRLDPSLQLSFERSWQRCWGELTSARDGRSPLRELLQAYAASHRHYHSQQHLHECLDLLQQHRDLAIHPAEVELALWFHDAVYESRVADNEDRSAQWAQDVLQRAGAEPEAISRVSRCILATRHEAAPVQPDEQLLVDIDLAILAAPGGRFEQYESQVRAEYAWVPESVYRAKRHEVLTRFLARDAIYSTPRLRGLFEQRARANLARAQRQLRG